MNQYVTGIVIKQLREKNHLTQSELAKRLCVSDKTISKWETAKGYPDISLLEPIAKVFGISITELISGNAVSNVNVSANIMRSKFYVCPVCGNIIHCMGEAVINCHGVLLTPAQTELEDEKHKIFIKRIEDEYYVRMEHDMTKKHYISFVAALSSDKIQMIKLYPESDPEVRFKIDGVKKIYFYCNRDGLFYRDVKKTFDITDAELVTDVIVNSAEIPKSNRNKVFIETQEFVIHNMIDGKIGTELLQIYGSRNKYLSALEDSTLHPEINATLREELKEIYFSFKDSAGKPDKTLELVWRLEENTKKMYRTSNAKYILLELAKNYLVQGNTAKLLDTLYGDGVTETIGKAIYDYYDINWRDV